MAVAPVAPAGIRTPLPTFLPPTAPNGSQPAAQTPAAQAAVEAAELKRLGNAFCHAKLLLTASELGLFADLDRNGEATMEEIGMRLGVSPRGLSDFLNALVAMGLLTRRDGRFGIVEAVRPHLAPGGPTSLAGFFSRSSRVLYQAWGSLTEAIRTGLPQVPAAQQGEFEKMLSNPRTRKNYLQMMDSVSTHLASHLAKAIDWSRFRHLVDVGGARGNLAGRLVKAHPHLSATVFDLPVMGESLAEHMADLCPPSPVDFVGGNFFVHALPRGDVLIIGHVLHNWAPDERELLVRKAFAALRPGGSLLVYDAMLEDENDDLDRLVVSLNMLLVTAGGSEYPASACERWMTDAGFINVSRQRLGRTDTLVIGHKPAAVDA
jgi:hypothetical protein